MAQPAAGSVSLVSLLFSNNFLWRAQQRSVNHRPSQKAATQSLPLRFMTPSYSWWLCLKVGRVFVYRAPSLAMFMVLLKKTLCIDILWQHMLLCRTVVIARMRCGQTAEVVQKLVSRESRCFQMLIIRAFGSSTRFFNKSDVPLLRLQHTQKIAICGAAG